MGLDREEFWWRISRFNWFGHQSRFDRARVAVFPFAPFITGHLVSVVICSFLLNWQISDYPLDIAFICTAPDRSEMLFSIRWIGNNYGRRPAPVMFSILRRPANDDSPQAELKFAELN